MAAVSLQCVERCYDIGECGAVQPIQALVPGHGLLIRDREFVLVHIRAILLCFERK